MKNELEIAQGKARLAERFLELARHVQSKGLDGFANMLESASEIDVGDMNQALDILKFQFDRA